MTALDEWGDEPDYRADPPRRTSPERRTAEYHLAEMRRTLDNAKVVPLDRVARAKPKPRAYEPLPAGAVQPGDRVWDEGCKDWRQVTEVGHFDGGTVVLALADTDTGWKLGVDQHVYVMKGSD